MTDEGFESLVFRFERAWRLHGPPAIADHLSRTSGPERGRLLVELICLDLEYRWRSPAVADRATLDDYLNLFPELSPPDRLPIALIGEEYRVRCRWGDRPSHAAFLARFDARREEIGAELRRVDREIGEEEAEPSESGRPARWMPPPEPPADLDPGMPLLAHGDFLLRRLIGAGRMGKVYEARQHGSGGAVAVKFLRKELLRHPGVVRRFIEEARTVARLDHPNIVGTRGLGRTPGGSYFLVMDLVPGPDLARILARGPVALDEALRWAIETCEALGHAHGRGVVHCDLKPANLLLDADGAVRVTDFGLARPLAGESPWASAIEGTAPFMAPEQAEPSRGPIDARTDVYGLGAVLFTLLTGRPPFLGRRLPDVLAAVIDAATAVPPGSLRPGLPGAVDDLCLRCLAKPPAARFASIAAVRSALAAALRAGP